MFEWNLGMGQNPTLLGSRSAVLHRHPMGHPQRPPVWLRWNQRRAAHTSWTLQHWTILLVEAQRGLKDSGGKKQNRSDVDN